MQQLSALNIKHCAVLTIYKFQLILVFTFFSLLAFQIQARPLPESPDLVFFLACFPVLLSPHILIVILFFRVLITWPHFSSSLWVPLKSILPPSKYSF